jgi:hypothetical protein
LRLWTWLRRRLRRTPLTRELIRVLAPGDDDEGRLRSVELVRRRGLDFVCVGLAGGNYCLCRLPRVQVKGNYEVFLRVKNLG